MAVIAVIMSVNFAACSDDDDDTIDTSSLEGTWGLVRSAGWELCSEETEKTLGTILMTHTIPIMIVKNRYQKLSDNTYSITSYYYSGSDWQMDGSQTGTLDGKTIVLKEHDGWFEYANPVIETLTTDKLVLRIK